MRPPYIIGGLNMAPLTLDTLQAERLKQILDGPWRYEPPFTQCFLPLTEFINQCKTELAVKGVFIGGGAVMRVLRGARTPLSDLDIHFECAAPTHWRRVEEVVLRALGQYAGCDCSREGGRKGRKLVTEEDNSFAIHKLPTTPYPIDLLFYEKIKNASFGSCDALRLKILEGGGVEIHAVDGYDVRKCLDQMGKNVFFVEPIERIATIRDGIRGYCRNITRGYRPKHLDIEEAYWRASAVEDKGLLTYLALHHPADLEGQFIFCLNYCAILDRCAAERPQLEKALFQQICIALRQSADDYTEEQRKSFVKYAQHYLYLRAEDPLNLQHQKTSFFPVNSDHYLLIRSPLAELSLEKILAHPLYPSLQKLFPCKEETLRARLEPPPVEKAPTLQELCGKIPMKQIIARYKQSPEPSCLEAVAAISIPALFELLSITPGVEAPLELVQKHPEEALKWLRTVPLAVAKKYISARLLDPLHEHFGDAILMDSIQLYIAHHTPQQIVALYSRLEAQLLASEEGLQILALFLPALATSRHCLDAWAPRFKQVSPALLDLFSQPRLRQCLQKLAPHLRLQLLALTIAQKQDQPIEPELQEMIFLLKSVRQVDGHFWVQIITSLMRRKEGFKYLKQIGEATGQKFIAIRRQIDLLESLTMLERRLQKDSMIDFLCEATKIAKIITSDVYWQPLKEKMFAIFLSLKQPNCEWDFATADELIDCLQLTGSRV